MGLTLVYGIAMAIPAVVIAGPFLGRRLQRSTRCCRTVHRQQRAAGTARRVERVPDSALAGAADQRLGAGRRAAASAGLSTLHPDGCNRAVPGLTIIQSVPRRGSA